jgi:predicted ATP-grasp superfamily ATP-dependent carboligase
MRVLLASVYSQTSRATLAAVRDLGKAGVDVHVGSERFLGQPFHSRYCRQRLFYPHPSDGMDPFLRVLRKVVEKGRYSVLLPMSEFTLWPILKHRSLFDPFVKIPCPDYDTACVFRDKLKTMQIADNLGIAVAKTYAPSDIHELRTISKKIQYPCVFKLRRGAGAVGLKFPESAYSLRRCYESLPAPESYVFDYGSPLVQEFIPGAIHDVCALFNRGEPRAVLSQKRLVMYPETGGGGIYNITTDERELKQKAVKLLRALNWHGPAQVEFKWDKGTGRAVLMEVNGRFWGTLDLSIQAGIHFPLLTCQMAVNGDVESVYRYKVGMKYRWPFPLGLLYALRTEEKLRAFCDFFALDPLVRSDFLWTDPLPHWVKWIAILKKTFTSRFFRSSNRPDQASVR